MAKLLNVCILILIDFLGLKAQSNHTFALNLGYIESFTRADISPGNLIGVTKYYGKSGLYAGLSYELNVLNLYYGRTELNYQSKGSKFELNWNGVHNVVTSNISYVSLSHLIRIISLKKLNVFVGPEANFCASRYDNYERVEPGILGCFTYKIRKIAVRIAYFKGLSRFERSSYNSQYIDLVNSNAQFGVQYIIAKVR